MAKRTGAPDFVGVGTYLAGTEWWMDLLTKHPRIVGPKSKKRALYFFERFCAEPMTDAHVAEYHAEFRRKPGQIAGEFSNRYSYDVWTLPLIKRAAPDAKLLMILRDPVGIYHRSLEYRRGKRMRWHKRRKRNEPIYMAEEVHRGRFGTQLHAVTSFFDREQILILQLEKLLRDPVDEYRRTLRFLGVEDDGPVPQRLQRPPRTDNSPVEHARLLRPFGLPPEVNLQPLRRVLGRPVPYPSELWEDIRDSLRAELAPEVQALLRYEPGLDLSLWPFFADLG
jgi:hypothetical protein